MSLGQTFQTVRIQKRGSDPRSNKLLKFIYPLRFVSQWQSTNLKSSLGHVWLPQPLLRTKVLRSGTFR